MLQLIFNIVTKKNKTQKESSSFFSKIKEYKLLFLALLIFAILFWGLLTTHMLEPKEDGLYSGGSTWGDLAFHLSIMTGFEEKGFHALNQFPVYVGEKLRYPWFADWLSALLFKSGLTIQKALILPSIIGILGSIILLYVLTYEITKSKIAGFLSPFLIFLNGSLIGLYYFWQDWKASNQGLDLFLKGLNKPYAHLENHNLNFSNIIDDYILPQRAFVWGLFLGLIVVLFLWRYWNSKNKKDLLKAGIFLSILPFIHTHTFLALVIVSGFLFIFDLINKEDLKLKVKEKFIKWLYFGVPILVVSLPQVLWLFPLGGYHFFGWHFGWMAGNENILIFWVKNLFPHLFVFILAYIFSPSNVRKFYIPFLIVFIISNLFLFQPSDFDNMKLMIWWFILSSILASGFLVLLGQKFKQWGIILSVFIFLSLTVVGSLSVFYEWKTSWLLFTKEDLTLAELIKQNTKPSDIFLTADNHNNPVATLAGRQIVMGYRGWLWSHGINYQEREADVLSMFRGDGRALELFRKYNVQYAVLDKNQYSSFPFNIEFFSKNFPVVYQSQNYTIFKTNL